MACHRCCTLIQNIPLAKSAGNLFHQKPGQDDVMCFQYSNQSANTHLHMSTSVCFADKKITGFKKQRSPSDLLRKAPHPETNQCLKSTTNKSLAEKILRVHRSNPVVLVSGRNGLSDSGQRDSMSDFCKIYILLSSGIQRSRLEEKQAQVALRSPAAVLKTSCWVPNGAKTPRYGERDRNVRGRR
ncbi:hypothetical protein DPX16_13606 [Anabarilius grahami]|uniref:Uncharacterized protein n=1 Tax=Anabarilius grahami TaxID=495550 RepID=A0A3N0XRK5_ANAGA|nr:hypothetical protein DPX16_13606 [Anabarilius grahami]